MDSPDLSYLVDAEQAREFWTLVADREAWLHFAQLTRDTNPLHGHKRSAKRQNFKNTIAPGMYVAAFVSAVYQAIREPRNRTYGFKFKEPVYRKETLLPITYSENGREGYSVNCIAKGPGDCPVEYPEKTVLEGRFDFPRETHPGNPVELPPWNYANSARLEFEEHDVFDYLVSFGVGRIITDFPEGIVPDMFVGSCFSGLMLNEAGNEGVYRTLDLSFQRPVDIGESLVLASRMGNVREKMGVRNCEFALAAYADTNGHELVAHGVAKGFLKQRS